MTIKAGVFDLDGVVTDTVKIHFLAWKRMFDEYLDSNAMRNKQPFQEFSEQDYLRYVDGKPRLDGVQSFLQSRNFKVDLGSDSDDATKETIHGLAKKKQNYFVELLNHEDIPLFNSTIEFIHQLHANHIKTAIVSSSKNCKTILNKAGIDELFDPCIDGLVSAKLGLAGKPHPDIFLEATKRLKISPMDSFVVEDAIAGVKAGKAAGFGLVIAINRKGLMEELYHRNGADIVIKDMSEITLQKISEQMQSKHHATTKTRTRQH